MSNEISEMLKSDDKGVSEAKGALSILFRQILLDINLSTIQWNSLMVDYLKNPRNGIPPNGRDRSTARGNLNKELRRPSMTWRNFMRGLAFLNPVKIKFEIHLTWRNKETTIHSLSLKTNRYVEEDEGNE